MFIYRVFNCFNLYHFIFYSSKRGGVIKYNPGCAAEKDTYMLHQDMGMNGGEEGFFVAQLEEVDTEEQAIEAVAKWYSKFKYFKPYPLKLQALINKEKDLTQTKPILCVNTGAVYKSISEAARELKLKQPNISAQLAGKLKSTGGLTFKYTDQEN